MPSEGDVMAKAKKIRRLESPPAPEARGRTAKTIPEGDAANMSTRGALKLEKRTDVSRPTGSGGGKNRGDRRDTSRLYTNNERHRSRGANPRPDVKTRK